MARSCFLLFFFLAIKGCLGLVAPGAAGFIENCDTSRCHNLGLRRDLESIGYVITTEEQMNRFCPPLQTALRCAVDTIQGCVGRDLDLVATSDNKTAASFAHGIVTIRDLINDICTPGSELRENYLSSVSCAKPLVLNPETRMTCRLQADAVYKTYEESKSLLGNHVSVEENEDEAKCMTAAYTFACLINELQDQCGEVARKTALEVLRRFKPLKWELCDEENFRNLKTEFLDLLQLEEEKRSIFSTVFDSRRRRK